LKGCPKGWPFIFIRTASDVKKKQDKSLKKKLKVPAGESRKSLLSVVIKNIIFERN
jgi:hypothetical protein